MLQIERGLWGRTDKLECNTLRLIKEYFEKQKIKNKHSQWAKLDFSLQWRHNDHNSVSNHQPHDCLLNRLFRRRSKKTSKLRVTGLCVGNSPGPVNSPHKGPVTRRMFPFDDVIMNTASGWSWTFYISFIWYWEWQSRLCLWKNGVQWQI